MRPHANAVFSSSSFIFRSLSLSQIIGASYLLLSGEFGCYLISFSFVVGGVVLGGGVVAGGGVGGVGVGGVNLLSPPLNFPFALSQRIDLEKYNNWLATTDMHQITIELGDISIEVPLDLLYLHVR